MEPQTFVVDVPDNLWMTSNSRLHHMAKGRRTRALREMAGWMARARRLKVASPVHLVVSVGFRGSRADPTNVEPTVKALVDGMTDAGVWEDDSSDHIARTSFERGPNSKKPGHRRITMILEPVEREKNDDGDDGTDPVGPAPR